MLFFVRISFSYCLSNKNKILQEVFKYGKSQILWQIIFARNKEVVRRLCLCLCYQQGLLAIGCLFIVGCFQHSAQSSVQIGWLCFFFCFLFFLILIFFFQILFFLLADHLLQKNLVCLFQDNTSFICFLAFHLLFS